jgi:hypothetical protein
MEFHCESSTIKMVHRVCSALNHQNLGCQETNGVIGN